jgi:hypothetical protein
MSSGSLQDLFRARQRRFTTVQVPQLEASFRIQSLNEKERSSLEALFNGYGTKLPEEARLALAKKRLVALCLIDDEGNRLITDDQIDSIDGLDGDVVNTLFLAASQHINLGGSSAEAVAKK